VVLKNGMRGPAGRNQLSNGTTYRPHIDGLRAVAVILVVSFHAFPDAMPAGFIGVDVFFVISGFLITGIIETELNTDQFSLVDFYSRRIRRIFPALITVLLGSLVIGWFCLLPDAYRSRLRSGRSNPEIDHHGARCAIYLSL
jgi:peptidoglycan/LPS O-acetylase OafA/YrhL